MNRIALFLIALGMAGCTQQPADESHAEPQQAGEPSDPMTVATRIAATDAAASDGGHRAMREGTAAFQEDYRKSIKLADATRPVDRELARSAASRVEGVRSAAWLDNVNLLAIVVLNNQRSHQTIDAICLRLEPLGDTLGVVVNLQSGAAVTGEERAILSRNCQLAPIDQGLLQGHRQVDVIPPPVRAQQRAMQKSLPHGARDPVADAAESLRIIKASTKEM